MLPWFQFQTHFFQFQVVSGNWHAWCTFGWSSVFLCLKICGFWFLLDFFISWFLTRTSWLRICYPRLIEELVWFECWTRLQLIMSPGGITKLICLTTMSCAEWMNTRGWLGCNKSDRQLFSQMLVKAWILEMLEALLLKYTNWTNLRHVFQKYPCHFFFKIPKHAELQTGLMAKRQDHNMYKHQVKNMWIHVVLFILDTVCCGWTCYGWERAISHCQPSLFFSFFPCSLDTRCLQHSL